MDLANKTRGVSRLTRARGRTTAPRRRGKSMNVHLSLEDAGSGKVTAHATVVNDDGSPKKGISVTLKANGKGGKPVRVDDDGNATKEFTLKVGVNYEVTATVVGSPHVMAREHITPEKKKRRPTHWVEWIFSVIFLIMVLKWGYTTLTVVGLLLTMVILFLGAARKSDNPEDVRGKFWEMLTNNDWVFWMIFGLMVGSFVFFLLSFTSQPAPEMNPVKWALGKIKDAAAPPPTDPWAQDGWSITRLLLGHNGGWGKATLSCLMFLPLAYITSFWDNWVARLKASKGKGKKGLVGRGLSFLFEDFVSGRILKLFGLD